MYTLKTLFKTTAAIGINAALLRSAVKSNEKYNEHLATLSKEDREKLEARDEYLKRHACFFNAGAPYANMAFEAYKQTSKEEKRANVTKYRWDNLRKSNKI